MPHDFDADTWLKQAQCDLQAAEHLLQGDYPAHATVLAHLALEKALKGIVRQQTGDQPPVTHDLRYLAGRVDLSWNSDRWDALDGLSDVSILSLYAPDRVFGHPVSDRRDAARKRVADARLLVDWLRRVGAAEEGESAD